jgi:hypothetical protein
LTYQLILDPVGAAALEAAIGPLSAPVPGPDGQRDPRSPQTRRGQALIEVCRRATNAADRPPAGVKTTLMLTMSYDDLAGRVGAATVVGSPQGGSLIAPDTVRRLACDANVIPTVLGSRSEVLDQGRATRLATPGQLAALWLRDAGCTFPGCTTPAHWCDAHHLTHWADGGTSTLTNLALLCGRHHSIVHRDHLIGRVTTSTVTDGAGTGSGATTGAVAGSGATTGAVTWDLIPGSYHRRDDGPPPAAHHPSGDPPPATRRQTPQALQGSRLVPTNRSTPKNAPTPDHHGWDIPAPDADPWADRAERADSQPPHRQDPADANPEADPWADRRRGAEHDDAHQAHQRQDPLDANPEADPWFDSGPAA